MMKYILFIAVIVLLGFFFAVISGLLTTGVVFLNHNLGLVSLLIGRIILGYSESLLIIGVLSWGVGLV
ncbi:hypothetical protein [Leptospira abararensis]|uniref:hypothetical protein n=1 Tax=Leptospira abararensis TaxID=2810036 RepID=UPI001E57D1F0|nr:hypothetical protein [Leptospira abararensis]